MKKNPKNAFQEDSELTRQQLKDLKQFSNTFLELNLTDDLCPILDEYTLSEL